MLRPLMSVIAALTRNLFLMKTWIKYNMTVFFKGIIFYALFINLFQRVTNLENTLIVIAPAAINPKPILADKSSACL